MLKAETNINDNNAGYDRIVKFVGLVVSGFIAYRFIKNYSSINNEDKNNGKLMIIPKANAIKGREWRLYYVNPVHFVTKNRLFPPFENNLQFALFGMGNFCEAEQIFLDKLIDGIFVTNVGYTDGFTKNPTIDEIKTNKTGHNMVVRIIFDPEIISYSQLLITFLENHDMTQSAKCTYNRSIIYYYNQKQAKLANYCLNQWLYLCKNIRTMNDPIVYTKIKEAPREFFYAEDEYQCYMAKHTKLVKNENIMGNGIGIKFSKTFVNELNEMEKEMINEK